MKKGRKMAEEIKVIVSPSEDSLENGSGSASLSGVSETGSVVSSTNAIPKSGTGDVVKDGAGSRNTTSKDVPAKKQSGRVVQSRFRNIATSGSKNSSENNSSSSSRNSSSNVSNSSGSSRSGLNVGPPGGIRKKAPSKTKPVRGGMVGPKASGAVIRSTTNLAKMGGVSARQMGNLVHQGPNSRSTASLDLLKPSDQRIRTPTRSVRDKAKFHSTALNATRIAERTLNDSSDNVFSTTLVGGLAPISRKLNLGPSLPELPDISAIRLDSNSCESHSDVTVLSTASEKDSSPASSNSSFHEVTPEELDLAYMRYLQWLYLDIKSDDAFRTQVSDMQAQITFLEHLTAEKEKELSSIRQKVDLVQHHQRVGQAYQQLTQAESLLVDSLPAWEEAYSTMSRELEKNLHQVKMDNIYVPENHDDYRDELSKSVESASLLLTELQGLMEPWSHTMKSTNSLLDDLENTTQGVQKCESEVQQAAGLAVQEASLRIGAQQMSVTSSSLGTECSVSPEPEN